MTQPQVLGPNTRPEISVYWQPGCTSCLKLKEFVEELGVEYESINVIDSSNPDLDRHLDELAAVGYKSIPVVRKGDKYAFAQSIDDVAELLGVSRGQKRLTDAALFAKWDELLETTLAISEKFPEEELQKWVIPNRDRRVKELINHVAQIPNTYIRQVEEGLTDVRPYQNFMESGIVTRTDLLTFLQRARTRLQEWVASGKPATIPTHLPTSYGIQQSSVVLERAIWHCAQHVRQLDILAAGRVGAEFQAPAGLFEGLPLPKRLWQ